MPRGRSEAKPPWREIPSDVRGRAEDILGNQIAQARRAWGGYARSVTFRLYLADGRRAFFKGVNRTSNEHMRWALDREERVYRELAEIISPWAPLFCDSFRWEDWHVLLLEDVGPASVPPWTDDLARAAAQSFAELHRATLGRALPDWLSDVGYQTVKGGWGWLAQEPDGLGKLAGLAGEESGSALQWLSEAVPIMRAVTGADAILPPHALLHLDTRSDNIRIDGRRLRLFDWPFASVGPAEIDVAYFAQTVTVEGGPQPEQIVAWYGEVLPVRRDVLDSVLAALAGVLAKRGLAPQRELPATPADVPARAVDRDSGVGIEADGPARSDLAWEGQAVMAQVNAPSEREHDWPEFPQGLGRGLTPGDTRGTVSTRHKCYASGEVQPIQSPRA